MLKLADWPAFFVWQTSIEASILLPFSTSICQLVTITGRSTRIPERKAGLRRLYTFVTKILNCIL